jgi:hypothetical protein
MLEGVAPLLVFNFQPVSLASAVTALAGIPIIGSTVSNLVGIPVPLYLDEKLTGIYVESETKAIDIDTNVQARSDGKPPSVDQRGLNNLVTINMIASRDSVILAVLLALNDQVFSKVVAKNYSINYFNGITTIFGGLLHGFSTTTGTNDDLIRITMQISKANSQSTAPSNVISVLPKVTGALPVAVPS